MLNTIRHIINDDAKWWSILRKYTETYRHQIINTETVINFFNSESGMNLTPVFNQYLKHKNIPELMVAIDKKKQLSLKWNTDEPAFKMPIEVEINGKKQRIQVTNNWTKNKGKIKKPFGSKNFNANKCFFTFSIQ